MFDRTLGFERLDHGGIDEELSISKHTLVDTFTVLFAFFLLNRVDGDTLHLRSELVVDSESIFLSDSLLDRLFGLVQ